MITPFQIWLRSADEDGKREASEYRHHYPVEQITYVNTTTYTMYNESFEQRIIKVVCGCNPDFAYTYGEGEHR